VDLPLLEALSPNRLQLFLPHIGALACYLAFYLILPVLYRQLEKFYFVSFIEPFILDFLGFANFVFDFGFEYCIDECTMSMGFLFVTKCIFLLYSIVNCSINSIVSLKCFSNFKYLAISASVLWNLSTCPFDVLQSGGEFIICTSKRLFKRFFIVPEFKDG